MGTSVLSWGVVTGSWALEVCHVVICIGVSEVCLVYAGVSLMSIGVLVMTHHPLRTPFLLLDAG